MTESLVDRQDPPLEEAFEVRRPESWRWPLLVASPHSGRVYPDWFVAQSPLTPQDLRMSEDCCVDEIFAAAPAIGVPLIRALIPRAFLDLNREPWELDPQMFSDTLPDYINTRSSRVQIGLGTIARSIVGKDRIYRDKLTFAEAESRIHRYYHPYHTTLRELIAEARDRFGGCLLLDCHSMPSIGRASAAKSSSEPLIGGYSGSGDADMGDRVPQRADESLPFPDPGNRRPSLSRPYGRLPALADIVLGDCFGSSCAATVTLTAEQELTRQGLQITRNSPYAGGFTTQYYGKPAEGVHVLQIEVKRSLYMDESRLLPTAGFLHLSHCLAALVERLGALARDHLFS